MLIMELSATDILLIISGVSAALNLLRAMPAKELSAPAATRRNCDGSPFPRPCGLPQPGFWKMTRGMAIGGRINLRQGRPITRQRITTDEHLHAVRRKALQSCPPELADVSHR